MRHIAITLLASLFLPFALAAETAETDDFYFDLRYEVITPQQVTQSPGKVEVVELFWYGCPHCNDFEPYIQKWLKNQPEGTSFRRLPVVFRDDWVPHARAYFTAEALDVVDKIHVPMFNAIHKRKKKMDTVDELAELFEKAAGVEKKLFLETYNSFGVSSKLRYAAQMQRSYGISGVPTIIVNGKYRTSAGTAGGYGHIIDVINHLVEKEKPLSVSSAD